MTAPSGKQYAVGMRHARVYALNANGYPAATATTAYEGLQTVGSKAFELTIPDARRIAHIGDDRILAQDILPRQEVSGGTLRVARHDHDVHAMLTGTKAVTIGEAKGIGYGTDKQGAEPDIALLLFQQSLDSVSKLRRWRSYLLPVTRAIVNPANMNENAPEFTYQLLPQTASKYPWGISFAALTEGFVEAEILEFMTENLPHIVAWKADGVATNFLFNTSCQAVSTDKIHVVTNNGTDVTATVTKAVTGITFTVAPTTGNIIVCFYEYAA